MNAVKFILQILKSITKATQTAIQTAIRIKDFTKKESQA